MPIPMSGLRCKADALDDRSKRLRLATSRLNDGRTMEPPRFAVNTIVT